MFEILNNDLSNLGKMDFPNDALLLHNGEIVNGVKVYVFKGHKIEKNLFKQRLVLTSKMQESTNFLLDFPFSAFSMFSQVNFNPWVKFNDLTWELSVFETSNGLNSIEFRSNDYKKKIEFVHPNTFIDLFERILFKQDNNKFKNIVSSLGKLQEIHLCIDNYDFKSQKLSNDLNNFYLDLYDAYIRTVEILNENNTNTSIIKQFNFPISLTIVCEQYLLYFAQFLKDLGIDATSNIKEEAGRVLFSVTPTNDIEALDKIREALAVYLSLPSSPVIYDDSFQSMQLKQQVENLQHSQRMKEIEMRSAQYALRLAQQNIENQDKIITRQNSFIDNQNKIIEKITDPKIMMNSLENKEELEKFCEGFEVGKSEFLIKNFGLHINPATVLKNVGKNILGKEEDKSVLGLDEEE